MLMLTPKKKETKIKPDVTGRYDENVEVTPEMIAAGVSEFCDYSPQVEEPEELVENIFRRMLRARTGG